MIKPIANLLKYAFIFLCLLVSIMDYFDLIDCARAPVRVPVRTPIRTPIRTPVIIGVGGSRVIRTNRTSYGSSGPWWISLIVFGIIFVIGIIVVVIIVYKKRMAANRTRTVVHAPMESNVSTIPVNTVYPVNTSTGESSGHLPHSANEYPMHTYDKSQNDTPYVKSASNDSIPPPYRELGFKS